MGISFCPLVARLFVALLAISLGITGARAEPRTALVIGNAAYRAALRNPINDASDIARALERAGFAVTLKANANQRTMREAIRDFGQTLEKNGGVGFFYFSGHGVQLDGENYLLPVGEDIENEGDLKEQAVTAAEAVVAMAAGNPRLNIVVLDACRNNPLPGGDARGLSRMDSSANLFVSFATSPGEVALDGEGRNSPYTKHLADSVATADLNLEETFKRTLKGVYQETRGKQTCGFLHRSSATLSSVRPRWLRVHRLRRPRPRHPRRQPRWPAHRWPVHRWSAHRQTLRPPRRPQQRASGFRRARPRRIRALRPPRRQALPASTTPMGRTRTRPAIAAWRRSFRKASRCG